MAADIISGFAPNRLVVNNTQNTTSPILIAMDGIGYASLAALQAVGKTTFPFGNAAHPGLDPGMVTQILTVENMTEAKAFSVVWNWNSLTPPTAAQMVLIPDGISVFEFKGPVGNVWIAKSVGADNIQLAVGY